MGLYDREYYRGHRSSGGAVGDSAIVQIVFVCAILFIADLFANGQLNTLLQINNEDYLRPWRWFTFITYGFVHADARHVIFNMFAFWVFGRMLENVYSPARIWRVFIASLLFSSVGQTLLSYPFERGGFESMPGLLGASGGVMAITMLTAFHFPRVTVLVFGVFPCTLWSLALVYVGIDLFGVLQAGSFHSNVGHLAHLCGAAFGAIYYQYLRQHDDDVKWNNPLTHWWKRSQRPKLRAYRPPAETNVTSDDDKLEAEVDRILVKIQELGRDSLTAKEQKTLEDASLRLRKKKQQS